MITILRYLYLEKIELSTSWNLHKCSHNTFSNWNSKAFLILLLYDFSSTIIIFLFYLLYLLLDWSLDSNPSIQLSFTSICLLHLSTLIDLSNHFMTVVRDFLLAINFLLIFLFNPFFNSSINTHPLYLLPLAVFLKNCTCSLHEFSSWSNNLNSPTFQSLFIFSNSLLIIPLPYQYFHLLYFILPSHCSSILQLFLCTYNSMQHIFVNSLSIIFTFIYKQQTFVNSTTFSFPLNIRGRAFLPQFPLIPLLFSSSTCLLFFHQFYHPSSHFFYSCFLIFNYLKYLLSFFCFFLF